MALHTSLKNLRLVSIDGGHNLAEKFVVPMDVLGFSSGGTLMKDAKEIADGN